MACRGLGRGRQSSRARWAVTFMDGIMERTRKIRQIVSHGVVETQQDLVAALRHYGIRVTQATVSRDIKRVGLVKVPAGDGRSRYALPGATPASLPDAEQRLRTVVQAYVTEIEMALDLILVKTERGGAAPVAQAIDDARWPGVAGTLAGEDTIIVVPRTRTVGLRVAQRLKKLTTSES